MMRAAHGYKRIAEGRMDMKILRQGLIFGAAWGYS